MTKERIEIIRQSLIPFVKKELLKINYEGLGKSDAKEFEKDLNEVLDLASKALEQQSSEDCADINHVIATISQHHFDKDKDNFDLLVHNLCKEVKALPPVIPTHGTCKDCKHWKDSDGIYRRGVDAESKCSINIKEVYEGNFYCKDFEKRGNSNDMG